MDGKINGQAPSVQAVQIKSSRRGKYPSRHLATARVGACSCVCALRNYLLSISLAKSTPLGGRVEYVLADLSSYEIKALNAPTQPVARNWTGRIQKLVPS